MGSFFLLHARDVFIRKISSVRYHHLMGGFHMGVWGISRSL
jgi:hypothetical protein